MNKWEKLSKEFDDALNSMTPAAWEVWHENVERRRMSQTEMKIDQEDFNRKAQHILDTEVKPQVEKYERAKAISEAAANLADPNLDKTDNWIAGATWMEQQIEKMKEEKTYFDKCHLSDIPKRKLEKVGSLDLTTEDLSKLGAAVSEWEVMSLGSIEWLYSHLFPKQIDRSSDEEWNKIDLAFKHAKEMDKDRTSRLCYGAFRAGQLGAKYLYITKDSHLSAFETPLSEEEMATIGVEIFIKGQEN
jgi:hypothetical protein